MNNVALFQKTKEIIGDYMILGQSAGISIPDYVAIRKEAIFELQQSGSSVDCSSVSPVQMTSYNEPYAMQSSLQPVQTNPGAAFDPFQDQPPAHSVQKNHDPVPPVQPSPAKTGEPKKNTINSTKKSADQGDPFFRIINKIDD